jgi:hypothetical protein
LQISNSKSLKKYRSTTLFNGDSRPIQNCPVVADTAHRSPTSLYSKPGLLWTVFVMLNVNYTGGSDNLGLSWRLTLKKSI